MNTIVCPHCGQSHPVGAKYCPMTGKKITPSENPVSQVSIPGTATRRPVYPIEKIQGKKWYEDIWELLKSRRNPILILFAFIIFLILLATIPGEGVHAKTILNKMSKTPGVTMGSIDPSIVKRIDDMEEPFKVLPFTYHNFYLFSFSSLHGRIISLGMFNGAILVSPVKNWINEYYSAVENMK